MRKRRPKKEDHEMEKEQHDSLINMLKGHFDEDELEMRRQNQNEPDRKKAFRDLMRETLEMELGDDDDEEEAYEDEESEDSDDEEEDESGVCPYADDEEEGEDEEDQKLPKAKRKQLAIMVMAKRAGKKAM